MRICAVIKYPPVQGGVSAQGFWLARRLAERGHQVDVVTNAGEVEDGFRLRLGEDDRRWLTSAFDNGGRVRLHATEPLSPRWSHVPQANPFVTKLAGLATQVVRDADSEIIFSYYMEPNGVAGHLASSWTGRPHVLQHAGSDLGRLMQRPGLDTAYLEVFRGASGICTGSPYPFVGMGIEEERLYLHPPFHLPREVFSPQTPPLDLDAHVAAVRAAEPDSVHSPGPLVTNLPTIGIYGKLGESKGSFDLLVILDRIRREARKFNFVVVGGGRELPRFRQALREYGLEGVSWVLPFMPHWRIPEFIRACDAVCFLERDFPITFHAPSVPREVLACGTCLVLSGEILAKQPYRQGMESGRNFLLVEDPKNHAELAAAVRFVVNDPSAAREIGRRGADVLEAAPNRSLQAEAYERIFEDVLRRAAGKASRMERADRGLAPTRLDSLRLLAAPLLSALGDRADEAAAAHVEAAPQPPDPLADARELCGAWMNAASGGDEALREAALFTRNLLWLGAFEDEEEPPRFDRPDLLPHRARSQKGDRDGRWSLELVRDLAPLATRWLRLVRFSRWRPPGTESWDDEAWGEGAAIVFHKVPSLTGHHFALGPLAAEVLGACDGRRSVARLLEHYAGGAGPSREEVSRALGETLRRFYREGLTVFVEPTSD